MKIIVPLLLAVATLSSCSKDYSCQCVTKDKVFTNEVKNYPYKHLAKKEAKTAQANCEALSKTEAGVTITCTLIKD